MMEYRTPEKSINSPLNCSRMQGKPHKHCHHQTVKDVERSDEKKLTSLISRRTPLALYSPNNSVVPKYDLSFLSKKEEKIPLKRCFSKEVIDLSRRSQIIMTRESKAEICVPPKRMRLNDFDFARRSPPSPKRYYSTTTHIFSTTTKRKEESKQLKKSPSKLTLPPTATDSRKNTSFPEHRERRTPMKIPSANATITVYKKIDKRKLSFFLVPVENFPWEDWRESDYNNELVREMIYFSDAKTFPIFLFRQEGRLIIKFPHTADATYVNSLASTISRQDPSILFRVLKFSLTLPFKVIFGILKFIIGK